LYRASVRSNSDTDTTSATDDHLFKLLCQFLMVFGEKSVLISSENFRFLLFFEISDNGNAMTVSAL
jgi:hypothetical protein